MIPTPHHCPGCHGTTLCHCDACGDDPGSVHGACEWCRGTGIDSPRVVPEGERRERERFAARLEFEPCYQLAVSVLLAARLHDSA